MFTRPASRRVQMLKISNKNQTVVSYYPNAEVQNCTLLMVTGNGIWRFSESIHNVEPSNCKDLMWLETATVVMTVIFGVADRIISGFTVSGIAINRRIQISRGPTSVIKSSHIISAILSEVPHRQHHLKSFTAGGNCWDSQNLLLSCMTLAQEPSQASKYFSPPFKYV